MEKPAARLAAAATLHGQRIAIHVRTLDGLTRLVPRCRDCGSLFVRSGNPQRDRCYGCAPRQTPAGRNTRRGRGPAANGPRKAAVGAHDAVKTGQKKKRW